MTNQAATEICRRPFVSWPWHADRSGMNDNDAASELSSLPVAAQSSDVPLDAMSPIQFQVADYLVVAAKAGRFSGFVTCRIRVFPCKN